VRRVVYLDNLRVLLTVLVIVQHLAEGYTDVGEWYYQEPPSGPVSNTVLLFLMGLNQAFFMGFFFLIAGYFVPEALERKGTAPFVRDRLVRLGLPLVVYVFLLNALLSRLGGQEGWPMSPGPMWFLEILLLFTLAYVVARPALPRPGRLRIDVASTTWLAVAMGLGSFLVRTQSPLNVWWTVPALQPAHVTQYLCLFAVGVFASGSDLGGRIPPDLTRHWRRVMLGATGAVLAAFFTTGAAAGGPERLDAVRGGWTWESLVVSLWEQLFAVGIIVNLLREFRARRNVAGPVLSAAARSTYAVYVAHPIVVVLVAVVLRPLPVPSLMKFLIAAPVAIIALFAGARQAREMVFLRRVLWHR
jgi:hypothetical protein